MRVKTLLRLPPPLFKKMNLSFSALTKGTLVGLSVVLPSFLSRSALIGHLQYEFVSFFYFSGCLSALKGK